MSRNEEDLERWRDEQARKDEAHDRALEERGRFEPAPASFPSERSVVQVPEAMVEEHWTIYTCPKCLGGERQGSLREGRKCSYCRGDFKPIKVVRANDPLRAEVREAVERLKVLADDASSGFDTNVVWTLRGTASRLESALKGGTG